MGIVEKATIVEAQAGTTDKFIDAALLQWVTSTETRGGIVEKATNAEGKAGTTDKNITADVFQGLKSLNLDVLVGTETSEWISPAGLAAKDGGLITKVLNIGDWNMDLFPTVNVVHGLTLSKIIGVSSVVIIKDDSLIIRDLYINSALGIAVDGGCVSGTDATYIYLSRTNGGYFDNADYDSTSFNRGYIIVKYLPA